MIGSSTAALRGSITTGTSTPQEEGGGGEGMVCPGRGCPLRQGSRGYDQPPAGNDAAGDHGAVGRRAKVARDRGGRRGAGVASGRQDWLQRLLPLTLLIIVGLAGLRGAVGALRWNGPLHQDALIVGVVLEVFIVTMLVILLIRRRSGSQEATAVKLRGVLLYVLGAGGVAAAVLMVADLHLHAFSQHPGRVPSIRPPARPSVRSGRGRVPGRRRTSR